MAGQAIAPGPIRVAGLGIDRLSASLSLLVAGVGTAVFRFSRRYLDGEPGRSLFLARLAVTIGSAYVLMLSDHLALMLAAWTLTGLGLHSLLLHDRDRPEAVRPARKKFLISRLGDLALIAAIGLIATEWGTMELSGFLRAVAEGGPSGGGDLRAIGLLIALAALTKSAQVPFHSWLPETMEAPTPVSALMHAGIINAGGALLLKFAPVMARVPESLLLLSLVGTITVVLGSMAMWAQVKVKRTLAWSTVGQMGFMTVQCGLAAFPAAWLHILGHGLYKARAFLRSGELPGPSRPAAPTSPGRTLWLVGIGIAAAVPGLVVASRLTGFSPTESPGELALSAIVALSIGQLWAASLRGSTSIGRVAGAIAGTFVVAIGAFALYRGAGLFLAPVLADAPHPRGALAWAAAVVPVAGLVGLTIVHAALPALGRSPEGRAVFVHALNGFYLGAIADGLVDRTWGRLSPIRKGVQGA